MAMTLATNPWGFAAEPDVTLKIRAQVSKRSWTRRRGLTNAVPRLPDALAISQVPATATMNTGTARIAATLGGPPRTSSAAITTRLPVTCAVNSPRLKNPMTSTIPAITLSSGGRRFSNRSNSGESFAGFDSIDPGILSLSSGLRPHCAVEETIDDDLRNNETEAHSEN